MGDVLADIPVWREARRAIVVGGPRILAAARRVAEVERAFAPGQARLLRLPRALRLHQWVKNLLIFLPLLAVHHAGGPSAPAQAPSAVRRGRPATRLGAVADPAAALLDQPTLVQDPSRTGA